MGAINHIITLIVLVTLCSGCALERKLAGVVIEADLSTVDDVGKVATIDAKKSFAFCYVSAHHIRAVKLTIDPGPFTMTVSCGSDLRYSAYFSRDFKFVAEAGHEYRMEYDLYRCMRLVDETSRAVISDSCES